MKKTKDISTMNNLFIRIKSNTSGITLIALVITIIVLLILAGVSISLVVGENGVLTQASTSVVKTREASAREEVAMAWTSADAEYWNAWTNNSSSKKSDYLTADNLNKYLEGKGTVSTVKDNGNGIHTVTYTSAEDDMVYEIIVDSSGKTTVSSSVHKSEVKETLASKITPDNYGDYVNYEIDLGIKAAGSELSDGSVPKTDWRIFYKDTNNVYLIASDYLPASKIPNGVFGKNNGKYSAYWVQDSTDTSKLTTSGIVATNNSFLFTKLSNVTTTNKNYQAVSTLLDTSKWSDFAKTGYVDDVSTSVIGSPTIEMWMASWNARYEGETLSFNANTIGYQVGLDSSSLGLEIIYSDVQENKGYNNTLYYPHTSLWNTCSGYWLASPSAGATNYMLCVDFNDYVSYTGFGYTSLGVRPVVSLKSGIKATKDANDVWQLSE